MIQDHIILSAGATMTGRNVTRVDLCAAVYEKAKLSRSESSVLVDLVLDEITDTLAKGETVKLSSFGSFMVRKKGQRMARNPKTGTEAPITPRRVVCGVQTVRHPEAADQRKAISYQDTSRATGFFNTSALRPGSADVRS